MGNTPECCTECSDDGVSRAVLGGRDRHFTGRTQESLRFRHGQPFRGYKTNTFTCYSVFVVLNK